jgi:7-cyano-7-deazaguanine reductase
MKRYGERAVEENRLETWANPEPTRDYTVKFSFPEFTCLCPRSGYPDFATFVIEYVPDQLIVELRSLKLYFNSFRSVYISHEEVANKVFNDVWTLLQPRYLKVVADFNPRGNLHTVVTVEQHQETHNNGRVESQASITP